MTVTGPIDAAALGVTLPHEHLFLDLRNQFTEPDDPVMKQRSREPLSLKNVDVVRANPYAIRDNLLLDEFELAVEEVMYFKAAGGQSIVECTSIGIHREPAKLRALAERTGLNIVAGCGHYTQDTHPAEMQTWTPGEIAEQIIGDMTVGIDGTDVKAGVIGEIGTSFPLHPNEQKALEAAALAHKQTGAAIQIHTYPWGQVGLEAADLLLKQDVDPAKIVICHTDVQIDLNYIRTLLRRGVFVEFDNFGKEFVIEPDGRGFAGGSFDRDTQRIAAIKVLTDEGFAKQLLLTNDICLKGMLHRFGGLGYDHILRNIVPLMLGSDIDQATIDGFLQDNPRRLYGMQE